MIPTTRFYLRLTRVSFPLCVAALLFPALATVQAQEKGTRPFAIEETAERITLRGAVLEASIKKKGYVSGVEAGSFLDKKTGARDLGFGLDIQDWIMEPGSDAEYRSRLPGDLPYDFNNAFHGKTPKRSIEGPQICTQAKELKPRLIEGKDFVAIEQSWNYTLAAPGKQTGSEWKQTLVFPAGKRYFISSDRILSRNAGDALFFRQDMPGHLKHRAGDNFSEVYLSYHGRIPASEFLTDFPPDEKFNYRRDRDGVSQRMIRAYHTRDPKTGADGPWLAGMTLNPADTSEAWCHQRTGYVCFIHEVGERPVKAGESFGAAYIVGWFDSIEEMEKVFDEYRGHSALEVTAEGWKLIAKAASVAASSPASAADVPAAIPPITYTLAAPRQVSLAVYDAKGTLVRTLLSGGTQAAGAHTEVWDGLDRNGAPVPPEKYEWRLLADEGLKAEFLLGLGTTTDWPAYGEWVGNHDGTRTVALDAERNIFVGAGSGEGTDVLIKLSPDGKRRLWGVRQLEVADGVERLAVLGDTVFVLQKNKRVFALDGANGSKRGGKVFYKALHEKDVAWRWEMPEADKKRIHVTPMDMELVGEQLVFSYYEYDLLRFVSAKDATLAREVKVPRPGGLAAGPNQTLFIASEGKILALDAGRDQTRTVVEDAGLKSPVGLAWELVSGDLIVALNGDGSQHVRRYHDGKLVGTLGRKEGRKWGAYDPQDFHGLYDVQTDGKGGFYTIEAVPRRVAHFSGDSKRPDREWFGPVHWGAMLALDPENPTIAYFEMEDRQFMRAKLDFQTMRWTLTHIYERLKYPQPVEMGLRWQVKRRGGRTYLVNCGENFHRYAPFVVEVLDGGARLQMAAFLGRINDRFAWWREAAQREGVKNGGYFVGAAWTDANGDGRLQADEVRAAANPLGSGHVWLDKDFNVFIAAGDGNAKVTDANGRATLWYRIPNRAASIEDTPGWDWKDAQPVKAEMPEEFRRWGFPEMKGIAVDDQGSVYQLTGPSYHVGNTAQERELKQERHTPDWPHNYGAVARLFKWRSDGSLEWAVGKKANVKRAEQPGEIAVPVAFLGFAGNKFFIHDRTGRVTTSWTTDGLAAGYVFDRHVDDGAPPETIYEVTGDVSPRNFLMGDDHVIQNWVHAKDGHIYWATPGQDATALYRIHDWQTGTRQTGTIEVKAAAPAAQLAGSGLKAEYFATPDLSGAPAVTRVDDQIWFRGVFFAYCSEIKAAPFFAGDSPVPATEFSARWTGEVEPRFSEDYRLGFYYQGDCSGPGQSWQGSKVRLWVGDQLVLDGWNTPPEKYGRPPRSRAHTSAAIPLVAGRTVPIRVEFAANGAEKPHLHLYWESRTQDREHIPAAALYPAK